MTDNMRHSFGDTGEGGGAGSWGGDAYPAEQPQAEADAAQDRDSYKPLDRDYSAGLPEKPPVEYKWSMTGTHISVSGEHDHNDLFDMMNHSDDSRPSAWGTVQVSMRWEALWQIEASNMSLRAVEKRLEKYSKDQGWQHVTIIDHEGSPFMGIKQSHWSDSNPMTEMQQRPEDMIGQNVTLDGMPAVINGHGSQTMGEVRAKDGTYIPASWVYIDKHLREHDGQFVSKVASDPGAGDGPWGDKAWKVNEWPGDLMNDVKAEDMFSDPMDDEQPKGPFSCSDCQQVFPDFSEWRDHVDRYHINPQRMPGRMPAPVIDQDQPMPADFNTLPGSQNYNTGMPFLDSAVRWVKSHFVLAAGANEMIGGPIPFVFDIENDKVITGHPGERHADIQGQFTPGGVVEGLYLPNGKLQFRTDTDMPYTVRHMVQLWQKMHPELLVKTIEKLVNGKPYKLAAANIAHKVRNVAMADDAVANVYNALKDHGNIYVVGGAVRDSVLGRVPKDIDLMVQGMPMAQIEAQLRGLPGRTDMTGKAFGVLRYKSPDGSEVEIALPRVDHSTGHGHTDFTTVFDNYGDQMEAHPDFPGSPMPGGPNPYVTTEEDLSRRDFTGNSMCVNLKTGELLDPFHGAEDLKMRKLRTTWPGAFEEDPLRTVRALSSISRHGLMPDAETQRQMAQSAPNLAHLPNERVQAELDKVFGGDNPEAAMRMAIKTGVIHHIMPEFSPAVGFDQRNKHHRLPLDEHSLEVLRGVQEQSQDKDLRLAAFMHDIGKPGSFWQDDDGFGHYYQSDDGRGANHEDLGANITRAAMTRLKYPNARIDRVTHLVAKHMFAPFDTLKKAGRRISQVGEDHIMDLLKLRRADGQGKGTNAFETKTPVELQEQLAQQYMDDNGPTGVKSLVIGGQDLSALGIPNGALHGWVLNTLADKVIDDPSLNNRHDLLSMAQEMHNEMPPEYQKGTAMKDFIPGFKPFEEMYPDWQQQQQEIQYQRALTQRQQKMDGKRMKWERHMQTLGLDPATQTPPDFESMIPQVPPMEPIQKTSNILDPIQRSLDPDVFNDANKSMPKVKPDIAQWVRSFVFKTMRDAGWPDPDGYVDIDLTGSLTTYQWALTSDFDVSLWVQMDQFPEFVRWDLIKLMMEHCDGTIVPGTSHPIQCFVVDTEKFTPADLYKHGMRSAYDLDKGRWIVPPEKERVHDVTKEFPAAYAYALIVRDKIKMALKYDPPLVAVLWDNLHRQRRNDMIAGLGDFSGSNIAYKMIANSGLHPDIEAATGKHIA